MMSGPTPTTGVFQDLLNISVTLADAPSNLPFEVVTRATAPIVAPVAPSLPAVETWAVADVLAQATAAEAQNQTATIVLSPPTVPEALTRAEAIVLPKPTAPDALSQTAAIVSQQPTAPEAQNRTTAIVLPQPAAPETRNPTIAIVLPQPTGAEKGIEDADTVAAEKPEASSPPIDLALVPLSVEQMRPIVSAPAHVPAPTIAPPARTPSVSDAAHVSAPALQIGPQARAPAYIPATPIAPQARKLSNAAETPKPLDGKQAQWLPSVPQEPVTRADAMPGERPAAFSAPVGIRDILPQSPDSFPAPMLDQLGDRVASVDTQFGITATNTAATTPLPPASAPLAQLRQLVITADGEWIGALARDIVSHAARDNQLSFTLVPEHLGQLDVAVTTDNGKVDIRLETSTHAAAQAISAEQARLTEDLRHAGLKLGQFDMSNRQNGNGQQQAARPDSQHTDNDSTQAQTKASSKAQGRFA
jgi:flagellar hook-length control protein FliK